jgi:lipopolysaccharide export system permease protein
MKDLIITELEGTKPRRTIRAARAEIEVVEGELDFTLWLYNAEVESNQQDANGAIIAPEFIHFDEFPLTFPLSRLKERTERVNASMKSTAMLWAEMETGVDSVTEIPLEKGPMSESRTELNKRYSFSLACLTFALVGIPLGVTAQRRETSVGFALSLFVALAYMIFILVGDILNAKPELYPHLLMWAPNAIFLSVGSVLFYRLSRK